MKKKLYIAIIANLFIISNLWADEQSTLMDSLLKNQIDTTSENIYYNNDELVEELNKEENLSEKDTVFEEESSLDKNTQDGKLEEKVRQYLNRQKYALAISPLERLHQIHPDDEVITDQLYRCYILMGRTQSAKSIYKELPANRQSRYFTKPKPFSEVYAEGGLLMNNAGPKYAGKYQLTEEYNFAKPGPYGMVLLRHDIGNRISIRHGINYYKISGNQETDEVSNDQDSITRNHWQKDGINFEQKGYVMNVNVTLPKSWQVTLSGTVFKTHSKYYEMVYKETTDQQTEEQIIDGSNTNNDYIISEDGDNYNDYYDYSEYNNDFYFSNETLNNWRENYHDEWNNINQDGVTEGYYTVEEHKTDDINYMFDLNVTKSFHLFLISGGCSYGFVEDTTVYQPHLSLTIYPFGNLNLYSTSKVSGLLYDDNNHIVWEEKLGGRIKDWLWWEASYAKGDMELYQEEDLRNVYCMMYKSKFRISGNLIFTINKNLSVNVLYRYMRKENPIYYVENYTDGLKLGTEPVNSQNITAGVNWRF